MSLAIVVYCVWLPLPNPNKEEICVARLPSGDRLLRMINLLAEKNW